MRITFSIVSILGIAASSACGQTPFMIAVMPDTQNYARLNATNPGGPNDFFLAQTRWIVDNAASKNIVFATQLGDVVNDASSPIGANPGSPNAQWSVATNAMNVLRNSSVPHSILPGNHDWTSSNGTGNITHYRSRFGDTSNYFAGKSWFKGFDPVRGNNSAQRFPTPAGDMLHLALEWNAYNPATSSDRPDAVGNALAWAQQVIDANPGIPTIISTHNYLTPSGIRDAQGEGLFNTLVRGNSQVFMVLNGHYVGAGGVAENSLTSTNNRGQPVYQMLSDYQSRPRGGDGWMRLLTFDPANDRINVRTYTPVTSGVSTTAAGIGATTAAPADLDNRGLVEVDADSQFSLPLDFDSRFAAPIASSARSFQNGANGYAGTSDTYLRGDAPNSNFGAESGVWVDAVATSQADHGLVRFDGLFGSGASQIAPDRDVISARIRVRVAGSNGEGSGFRAHRMLRAWDESTATWNSLAGGISTDGFEALPAATSVIGADANVVAVPQGFVEIDITDDVRAWMNGAANHGVALIPFANGTNGVRFESSESSSLADRPQLIVDVTRDAVVTRRIRDGLNGYAGTRDTELRGNPNQRDAVLGASVNLLVDESFGSPAGVTQALLRFDGIVGEGAGQVPAGATLVSAVLKLNANDAGSGVALHRMLRDWNEQSTWRRLGDGVSLDGVEALALADSVAGLAQSDAAVDRGLYVFDVTASVRSWMESPGSNFGWLLQSLGGGTDGLRFDSSEAFAGLRPELVVRYLPASTASARLIPEPGVAGVLAGCVAVVAARRRR